MKHYSPLYFLGQSIKGLWRNGVMSFASITVLMSCLVVLGGFALIVVNIDINLEKLGLLNEIAVFVELDATDEDVDRIKSEIESLDNIESVEHVTKEEGLEDLKNEDPEYAYLYEDIDEDNNPLTDMFIIKYSDTSKVSSLDYQLRQIEGIRKVNNRQDIAVMMDNMKSGILLIFVWFLAILFVVSVFVIINTVKLAVFARRNEISIMRYVGATSSFITLPFVFEGAIIGVISGSLAYFIEWYVYKYIEDMMLSDLPIITFLKFSDAALYVFLGFIGIGVVTGVIGSCISLSRYCKQ